MNNKNELLITRVFDAPRNLVWEAWTNPEMIKKWWGPKEFTAPVIEVDLRKGGKYLYCMHGKSGPEQPEKDFWSGGEFKEVDAPNRIVITDYFTNEIGEKVDPTSYGMDPNFPKESNVVVKFEDEKGKTRLSIIYEPATEAEKEAMKKSGMEEGWNSSLDKLADSLKRV